MQHLSREEKGILSFGGEREIWSHLEDRDVGGRISLKCSLTSGVGDMHCILLAQDRDKWQAFVHAVVDFRVP